MIRRKKEFIKQIKDRLSFIYPDHSSNETAEKIYALLKKYSKKKPAKQQKKWDQNDAVLITYADSFVERNNHTTPLRVLKQFADQFLAGAIKSVHILPFFPYSSDDGFSVIDYYAVKPEHGSWEDIQALTEKFSLMFDLVINHASAKSAWFNNFLKGEGEGCNFFKTASPDDDLRAVVRPRSSSLLTKVETVNGTQYVWTTFSDDQVDLDFGNPEVLLQFMDILLFYMHQGAKIIRLDAIAFLWKEAGTTCLHLPQTHEVVKLMRDIMEQMHPDAVLLTETNVPNKENLSYFGKGDEAHMVYQFSLPPLLLHALYASNTAYLNQWAAGLPALPEDCTYFNFTASHDGIGVRPLEGLLPDDEFHELLDAMKKNGGLISSRSKPDGTLTPYEINITYFDALKTTRIGSDLMQVERFLCSQLAMLGLKGIPGIYIHSLFGTPNYTEGVAKTGRNRTINRKNWNYDEISAYLEDTSSQYHRIFNRYIEALTIRQTEPAFHPSAPQQIMEAGKSLFVFSRGTKDNKVVTFHNFSSQSLQVNISRLDISGRVRDILTRKKINNTNLQLRPYEVFWLKEF